jgi:hypothetical protein
MSEIYKLKKEVEPISKKNAIVSAKLEYYYSFDDFEWIGSDIIQRDMCLIDSAVMRIGNS